MLEFRPSVLKGVLYFSTLLLFTDVLIPVYAQDSSTQAKTTTSKSATVKPTNRTGDRKIESTITALDAAPDKVGISLKAGAFSMVLKPTTELVQEERSLSASDLKVDDRICLIKFKSKGSIKENAIVTGVNPLTLKIDDIGTLTVTKVEDATFSRFRPIQMETLRVGQTVAVLMRLSRDGEINLKRVAVIVGETKGSTPRRRTIKSAPSQTEVISKETEDAEKK